MTKLSCLPGLCIVVVATALLVAGRATILAQSDNAGTLVVNVTNSQGDPLPGACLPVPGGFVSSNGTVTTACDNDRLDADPTDGRIQLNVRADSHRVYVTEAPDGYRPIDFADAVDAVVEAGEVTQVTLVLESIGGEGTLEERIDELDQRVLDLESQVETLSLQLFQTEKRLSSVETLASVSSGNGLPDPDPNAEISPGFYVITD